MRYTVIHDSFELRIGFGPFVFFGLRRVPTLRAWEIFFMSFGMSSGIAPPAEPKQEEPTAYTTSAGRFEPQTKK